ncbi:26S proteasome non-ATPase regulatory subunit 6 homolog [Cajanus cajan]|uniref:26S proteasome non-ATPase regulatory subunit 6 homolog n=1 Tax=Cajanus cajan TaxID=3821 RepID=UPI0010FAF493|nr:26S proteasome non-ATPase regulatory subunit 6 homolog [Cajanus cajan]
MEAEEEEDEEEHQQEEHLVVATNLFLLTLPPVSDIDKVRLKRHDMLPFYETLIAGSVFDPDRALLDSLRNEKITDAEESLGESLGTSQGDRSKTVAVGQKMDMVFYTLQLGFFYMDFDLIAKSIEKAKSWFNGENHVGPLLASSFPILHEGGEDCCLFPVFGIYKSVTIDAMAKAFGLTVDFIDLEGITFYCIWGTTLQD